MPCPGQHYVTHISIFLLLALLVAGCTSSRAPSPHVPLAPYAAVLVRTVSGDTVVLRNTRNQSIETHKLAGVAAPRGGQPFAADAAYELQTLLDGSPLIVSAVGHDQEGHLLVFVCKSEEPFFKNWQYPPCLSENSLNRLLVRDGLVWVDRRQHGHEELAVAEAQAKEEQIGLWQQVAPIPPWQWELLPSDKQIEIHQAASKSRSRQAVVGASFPPAATSPSSGLPPSLPVRRGSRQPSADYEYPAYYWFFLGLARDGDSPRTSTHD